MIISASRRTDIPAYFTPWLLNRMQAGEVYTRNPVNPKQVTHISLTPSTVDGFVFWSKNPFPLIPHLKVFSPYPYYFQFTLTPYQRDIEPHLPKKEILINTFKQLANATSPFQVLWRYDPILISPSYSPSYHINAFEKMAKSLQSYTGHCTISFVDNYSHLTKAFTAHQLRPPTKSEILLLAKSFFQIAATYHLTLFTCCEEIDLSSFSIQKGSCINPSILSAISGRPYKTLLDKNQRHGCGCAKAIDIGVYNTCQNGCIYCYANHSIAGVSSRLKNYSPTSPLLCSHLSPYDKVTPYKGARLAKDFIQPSFLQE